MGDIRSETEIQRNELSEEMEQAYLQILTSLKDSART